MKPSSWLLFLLLAFLWGTAWTASKIALSYVSPSCFVLQRFILTAIVMFPFFLILRKRIPHDAKTLGKLLGLSLINAFWAIIANTALVGASSGIGAVLTYTQPLFVFCLAIPFLNEKLKIAKIAGTTLGFAGASLLFLSGIGSLTFVSSAYMIFVPFCGL